MNPPAETPPEPVLRPGSSAVLISIPHAGTWLPRDFQQRLTRPAAALPDTDWYVDRLYDWAQTLGAGLLMAPASRYIVDLNRPADDQPLYSETTSSLLTGLFPLRTFTGESIYLPEHEPGADECVRRLEDCWHPYHRCIESELRRIQCRHGYAILLDAHSIKSKLPLLFEGVLADLNLGSNGGFSAHRSLLEVARLALTGAGFTLVVDGRFKGGYITRHYGQPQQGIHALQLELGQQAYMHEEPPGWARDKAAVLQPVLRQLVENLVNWSPPDAGN